MPGWFPDLRPRAIHPSGAIGLAGWAYLGAALAVVVLLTVPLLLAPFGCRAYVIYGGSMGAALPNGSIAITRRIDAEAVKVGDVVAIKKSSRSLPVLHRVIGIDTSSGVPKYVTQGDANKAPDADPVSLRGAGDKVLFSIPWLGHLVHFARGAAGRVFLLFLPATLLAGIVLWQTWKDVTPRVYVSEEPQC
jgi:signal peptidase I